MNSMTGQGPTGFVGSQNTTGFKEKVPSGYKKSRLQQFTPEMMELFQQLFSHVGPESYLSRLASGDQSMFEEIEKPALRQFAGLQGNLASRFSGMGMGARRSSGFQNAASSQASDFAQQLQAQRQGLQRQAINDLRGFSSELLGQTPYETQLVKKSKPWWQELLIGAGGQAAQGAAQAGTMALMA